MGAELRSWRERVRPRMTPLAVTVLLWPFAVAVLALVGLNIGESFLPGHDPRPITVCLWASEALLGVGVLVGIAAAVLGATRARVMGIIGALLNAGAMILFLAVALMVAIAW